MNNLEVRDKLHYILSSKEEVIDRCIFTLLPVGYNNRKGNIITERITDELELEFKVDISDVVADSKVVMYEDTLKMSGISKEELVDVAMYNTERRLPARFDSISDVLGIGGFDDLPMYVLTNDKQVFGAGAILYEGMYKKISNIIGDFIVIPSSVHEVIVLPTEFESPYITSIIRDINRSVVADNEILSDRPYKLTLAGDLIEI